MKHIEISAENERHYRRLTIFWIVAYFLSIVLMLCAKAQDEYKMASVLLYFICAGLAMRSAIHWSRQDST